jgi:hypothetical protein
MSVPAVGNGTDRHSWFTWLTVSSTRLSSPPSHLAANERQYWR